MVSHYMALHAGVSAVTGPLSTTLNTTQLSWTLLHAEVSAATGTVMIYDRAEKLATPKSSVNDHRKPRQAARDAGGSGNQVICLA